MTTDFVKERAIFQVKAMEAGFVWVILELKFENSI
jgi:hypothetical protein